MSKGFVKVYLKILDSTISRDWQMRHVFEDLLKLCDYETGEIDIAYDTLSRRLGIPEDILRKNIEKLEGPDPESRDPDYGGRRLLRVSKTRTWGWKIVNWMKYRKLHEKDQANERARRYRQRLKESEAAGDDVEGEEKLAALPASQHWDDARAVIQKMNTLSGAKFLEVPSNLKTIATRLNESEVTLDGVMTMLERVWAEWKSEVGGNGNRMRKYFRIETLFKTAKFHDYYGQKDLPAETPNNSNKPRQSELVMSVNAIKPNGW